MVNAYPKWIEKKAATVEELPRSVRLLLFPYIVKVANQETLIIRNWRVGGPCWMMFFCLTYANVVGNFGPAVQKAAWWTCLFRWHRCDFWCWPSGFHAQMTYSNFLMIKIATNPCRTIVSAAFSLQKAPICTRRSYRKPSIWALAYT